MAQHDKLHIGDSQNSQWWGAKQGLFINALANQYGRFETDATYRATINQNTTWSIESWVNNACTYSNALKDFGINRTGISYINGKIDNPLPNYSSHYLLFNIGEDIKLNIRRATELFFTNSKVLYSRLSYDNNIIFSQNPPNILNGIFGKRNRVETYPSAATLFANMLISDNYYENRNTIRMNLYLIEGENQYKTGVVRDFRIYIRVATDKEISDNYHSMTATDTSNLFIEYKMSQLSDFYTFGGLLYARNTGSSGNGLDKGTGYDLQLLGYNLNIPILQSIY